MKTLISVMLGAALFSAAPAAAQESLYSISDGLFSDGTTFGGTFEYDPLTKQFGEYSVTTFEGVLTGLNYTNANSGAYSGGGAGPNNFIFFLDSGTRYFNFSFVNPLSTGTQNLNTASSYECDNCAPYRFVTAGSVSSAAVVSAVPEPGTWGMMLIGFGAVGVGMRRRRRNGNAVCQLA
jgi:hypothetical protein